MNAMEIAIQKVPSGNATGWIKFGWGIFKKAWLMWIVTVILFFIGTMILRFIPFIGQFLVAALGPIFGLATVFMVRSVEQTGSINWNTVIENVKAKSQPLLVFVCIGIGFAILSSVLLMVTIGSGSAIGNTMGNEAMGAAGGVMGALLGALISLSVGLIYAMGSFFAFPLIAFTDASGVDAFKGSFKATIVNMLPTFVYGIIVAVLSFGCMFLTLGLGFLIVAPVLIGANYQAAREMFPSIK